MAVAADDNPKFGAYASSGRERGIGRDTTVAYPVVERGDAPIRAFKDEVLAHLGQPMVDVRSPGEFAGELLHMPDYPQEGAMRGGHIPRARSVPWARAAGSCTEWGNAVGAPIEVGAR